MFNKVSFQERLLFTKNLNTMIKAGVPIADALQGLKDQTKNKYFKKVLNSVNNDVSSGKKLADALVKYPRVFDKFYISLVAIGEESGTLQENLEFLAQQLSEDYTLRKKIKGALLYPGIIFSATAIMGGFISLFILPTLVDFFEALEIDLPVTTQALLWFARLMKNYGYIIIPGLILLGVIIYFALKLKPVKRIWHRIVLKLPLLGNLIAYGQLSRFSRNAGVLLQSGVPTPHAIEVSANTLSNVKFREDLKVILKDVEEGIKISDSFEEHKFSEFPWIMSEMIGVGEETGSLSDSFLYLGSFYDDQIDNITKNLSTTLEPVLLIIIGLVVGFVALAIISPIYELTGSIRR